MAMRVRLMADYFAWPLWNDEGMLEPSALHLSDETKSLLRQWGEAYTQTLDAVDPRKSGFTSKDQEDSFERKGIELWQRLRAELGPDYEVVYISARLGREVVDPTDIIGNGE